LRNRNNRAAHDGTAPSHFAHPNCDKAGNRARRIADGTEELYAYDPRNRLTEITKGVDTTRFSYDANGNTTKAGPREYVYDALNRMTEVRLRAGPTQINRYDAEGLRAEMEENGKLMRFLYAATRLCA
jgi:YD repeat-containing protein